MEPGTNMIRNPEKSMEKIESLLMKEEISEEDLEALDSAERALLAEATRELMIGMEKGASKMQLLQKFAILTEDKILNEDIWEANHSMILSTIAGFVRQYGLIPSAARIARQTGISRKTVTKHLKEYKQGRQEEEQQAQHSIMKDAVIGRILSQALDGDLKAAKLYLSTFSEAGASENNSQPHSNIVNQQNNFLQINGVVVSQETLKQLPPEQMQQLESILTSVSSKQSKLRSEQ
jgi:hypothetical protein